MQAKLRERKCKNCKELFMQRRSLQYLCSPKCAIQYANKKVKVKVEKDWNKEKKAIKVNTHVRENKKQLQSQINLLARKIDAYFHYDCIDCGKPYGKQVDGAHFESVGSNSTLRYNLHNIHSARSYCNKYSDKHHEGYKQGLVKRYGAEYLELVEGLKLKYKTIDLSNQDIADKLAIVRRLNRDFDTFSLTDGISARNLFNEIIGIYK